MRLFTDKVVKIYRSRTVVKQVSVEVSQGEIVGLLGPNGAGKTTTFYMVVGIIKPNAGSVYMESTCEADKENVAFREQKAVCILDEAHLLEKETIEEFRFMLNYRFDSESPMALVLVGQTELWDKLKLQRYAAVRQRIDVNCVLRHLDRSETEEYIRSHLRYAGGREDLFTDIAMDVIQQGSSGIPRIINRICEKSLMYASQQGKRLIDEHTVTFVMEHEMLSNM